MNAPAFAVRPRSAIRTGEVRLSDGLNLCYAESGNPDGLPLVLLHGFTDSWRSFEPLLASLPCRFRAIALSQRGHGDSGKPEGRYDTARFAADLAEVMDRLGIDRAAIVGHSMGSLVAQRFAFTYPQRTLALVLVSAFATLRGSEPGEALWRDAVASLADPVDPALARDFQLSCIAMPVPSAFFEMVVGESLKLPARVWRLTLRALLDEDFSDQVSRIAAPTLVLWGDRDAFSTRAEQARLATTIPDASLVEYPGVGHAPHWEQPQRTAADIAAFVDGVAATSTPAFPSRQDRDCA
ncbi:MAG TPA: alpha/beta hydrolase [Vineibacter sp.]|nr:alpha/beta hydrolase [Vineibacter sp.]